MLDETIPLTRLDAVNICLAQIGVTAVQSLAEADLNYDAETALGQLNAVCQTLQETGWSFNTEKNWVITPDVNGNLVLPANTLKVDTVYSDKGLDLIQRGLKLYDRVNHTLVFTSPVYVDLVVALTFEEIPVAAKRFVAYSAARMFGASTEGTVTAAKITGDDERRAWVAFLQTEGENDDRTMATASPHMARMRQR